MISVQWSRRRVQKESDELLYTIWSLVTVRNQLPAQVVDIWFEISERITFSYEFNRILESAYLWHWIVTD